MKLFIESAEDIRYITEEESGNKKLYIEGVFLQSGIKNRNGRIYPEHVMDKEVARYIKEHVSTNTAMGELGHPNGPQINLDRVCHRIVSLKKEGQDYIGKALITPTPAGNIVRGLIESDVKLGVSSRGLGTVKTNSKGINEVQSDFRLATAADVVANPSAPSAWVNGIMESAEWVYDETLGWQRIVEETKQQINNEIRSRTLQENKIKLFEEFMRKVSKL